MKKTRIDRLDEFLRKENMSDQAGGTFKTINSMLSHLGIDGKKQREELISRLYSTVGVKKETKEMKSYAKNCIENKKEFILYFKKVPRGYHARIYLPLKK